MSESSRLTANIVTTTLAAVFNMLVVLVICFAVVPKIDRDIAETVKNRQMIEENSRLLEMNRLELVEQHRMVEQLTRRLAEPLRKMKD